MSATLTLNPLPAFDSPNTAYVSLPLHVLDIETHACIYCGSAPIWDTFEEYVAHFWEFEFEGEPGHTHDDEDQFEWFAASCLAAEVA